MGMRIRMSCQRQVRRCYNIFENEERRVAAGGATESPPLRQNIKSKMGYGDEKNIQQIHVSWKCYFLEFQKSEEIPIQWDFFGKFDIGIWYIRMSTMLWG